MRSFDANLLRQVGVGQNYLWEKYPGEIAPIGARVVDGMQAFMPAHTATVGLTGCAPCEAAEGQAAIGVGLLTPAHGYTMPIVMPTLPAPAPVVSPVAGNSGGSLVPPGSIPSLPVATTPVAVPAPAPASSTNTLLLVGGIAAVALGLGGILWLAHSQST
jgi:hypothetical protein